MENLGDILRRIRIEGGGKGKEEEEEACPICGGTGWLRKDVPLGHPDFGKVFPCECLLRDFERERIARLERYSNLGPLLGKLTFDNLKPEGLYDEPLLRANYRKCYDAAREYAENPKGWLVIVGPSGSGKTHMASAIANYVLRKGKPVFFQVVPELLDHLRSTFSPHSEVSYDELFDTVKNSPLLILDDLETHFATPWAEEKLFQILNHRYNSELPTVITTISLDNLDERLRTRLRDEKISRILDLGKREELLREIGGISEKTLSEMSFETFETDIKTATPKQRESLKKALEAAQRFASSPKNWLVLAGPHGSGKTHLAVAVAGFRIKLGKEVYFTSVPELLSFLRASGEKYEELEEIKKSPLLILDDLRVREETPWAREVLFQIINYRYNSRLPTLITIFSKYPLQDPLEELKGEDERILSRLRDPKIVNIMPLIYSYTERRR